MKPCQVDWQKLEIQEKMFCPREKKIFFPCLLEHMPDLGQDKGQSLNSAYNEVTFNKKLAITKENLCTKYIHSPINTSPLTKSCL